VSLPKVFSVMRGRRRAVLAGIALAAAYLVVAGASFSGGLLPRAPVLDGLSPPPPYQWVNPPPDRVKDNKPPSPGTGTIPLTSAGAAGSVTTPDGQCQVLFDSSSVPLVAGQTSVSVSMSPIDPATVGAAPAGFSYDSNAYTITAAYEPSGQAISTLNVTVVLTYATNATEIMQRQGSTWKALASTPAGQNQLFAPATSLGTFSTSYLGTGGTGSGTTPTQSSSTTLLFEIIGIFAVVVALAVVVIVRARAGRRQPPGGGVPPRGSAPRR
jgi:hypothetical protein